MELLNVLFIGAVWYQTVFLISLFCLFVILAFDELSVGAVPLVAWIGLLFYLGKVDVNHIDWVLTIEAVVAYLVVGIIWSGYKWFVYVRDLYLEHVEARTQSYRNRDLEYKSKVTTLKQHLENYKFDAPKSKDKISSISGWIIFWEFSIIKYLLNDFVVDLIKRLGGYYSRITAYAIKG